MERVATGAGLVSSLISILQDSCLPKDPNKVHTDPASCRRRLPSLGCWEVSKQPGFHTL